MTQTGDEGLLDSITAGFDKEDPRSLNYLIKAPKIKNERARAYAAAALFGHASFDPDERAKIATHLLEDEAVGVRTNALAALANRHDLLAQFRIKRILAAHDREPLRKQKPQIYCQLFSVIQYLPLAGLQELLQDRELNLAARISRDLQSEHLEWVILVNSRAAMRKDYPSDGLTREELAVKVGDWWQQLMLE